MSIELAEYLAQNHKDYKIFVYCRKINANLITASLNEILTIRKTSRSLYGRFRDVLRYIREDKIDIVVEAVWYMHGTNLIKRKTGVKVIYANHGQPFWQEKVTLVHKKRRHPLLWRLFLKKIYLDMGLAHRLAVRKNRKLYKSCDYYTVLCNAYKQEIETEMGIDPATSHIVVIENSSKSIEEISYEKDNIILYCGRLVYDIKRVDRLLRIWGKIQDDLNDWKLVLVGGGNDEPMLKEMVKRLHLKNVFFKGIQKDVSKYYQKASIVCLTSEAEGWGLCLTEAQSHGCIPMAYNCSSGVEEVIGKDRKYGFLAEPFNEDNYASTLLKVAKMPEKDKMQIRKAAVQKMMDYTPDIIFHKWKILFDKLTKDKQQKQ